MSPFLGLPLGRGLGSIPSRSEQVAFLGLSQGVEVRRTVAVVEEDIAAVIAAVERVEDEPVFGRSWGSSHDANLTAREGEGNGKKI